MENITTLVVENHTITRKILYNILQTFGTCDVACEGLEGLERVKQSFVNNNHYDLFCLDIEMQNFDGLKLLELVRKLEKTHNVEKNSIILMTTAHGVKDTIRECCQLGCSGFLVKPVEKYNLLKILKKHKLIPRIEEHNSSRYVIIQ